MKKPIITKILHSFSWNRETGGVQCTVMFLWVCPIIFSTIPPFSSMNEHVRYERLMPETHLSEDTVTQVARLWLARCLWSICLWRRGVTYSSYCRIIATWNVAQFLDSPTHLIVSTLLLQLPRLRDIILTLTFILSINTLKYNIMII